MEAGGINMAPAFPVWGHGHSTAQIRRDDLPAGGIYNGEEAGGGGGELSRWWEGRGGREGEGAGEEEGGWVQGGG